MNGQFAAQASTTLLSSPVPMDKRERIKLERIAGDNNRVASDDALVIWYDTSTLDEPAAKSILPRLATSGYTGVVFHPETAATFVPLAGARITPVLSISNREELEKVRAETPEIADRLVVAAADKELLSSLRTEGFATCLHAYVDDAESLHAAIHDGAGFEHLMIKFRDPTNIPLELVIASLQATHTILIKEIADNDVDDAVVTLGVMEVGADGVMFSPSSHELLDAFTQQIGSIRAQNLDIQVGTIIRSQPVGMGYRSCIDLATLFSPTEGMLVGSTSQGGILCCPEVFFLPYMELRPFRVNAGAVHSYVYNASDRTDYMTELRAGSQVLVVDASGACRKAAVGRIKTEVRPLRLIEVEFERGERVNVLMQDDWHVRIFSAEKKPLNITALRPGDKVLGYVASPGRHVGIKVDEHIIET